MSKIIKEEITKNIIRDIYNIIPWKDIFMISLPSGGLSYLAYITEPITHYAPFSYGLIILTIITILSFRKVLKENQKNEVQNIESYIEFEFNNGFVPIKSQNAFLAHASHNETKTIMTLFIIFENKIDYSSLVINPKSSWKKINFHNRYVIIDMWDIRAGTYKIEFK